MADHGLQGRVAVVTGASVGIGAAVAAGLRAAGARLVLAARHPGRIEDAASEAEVFVRCDVADAEDRRALVETAVERFGHIDLLVNNAGFARSAPALEEDEADIERAVSTNLTGPFALTRLVGARMVERGSGVIVNVASLIGTHAVDRYDLASYAASKAGLIALTRELASQWGQHGVRVNAVAPGWFPTRMTGFMEDQEHAQWVARHTALGRHGRLEEIVGPVLFLAGDESSYITGQTVAVDGGWI